MSELANKLIRENLEKHQRGEDASYLELGWCGLTEVPIAITECTHLKTLILSNEWEEGGEVIWSNNDLDENNLRSIENLRGLINLEKLIICNPSLSFEIDVVTGKTVGHSFTSSHISSSFTDITPLSGLTKLTELVISSCPVKDIKPLSNLTNLKTLDISHTEVVDLSPLHDLRLENLRFKYTEVSDISPLNNYTTLKNLIAYRTKVKDLEPLKNAIVLNFLDVSSSLVDDISPLKKLITLSGLALNYNNITDLAPLSKLLNLTMLSASGLKVSDLSSLAGLTKLNFLDISFNRISNLAPIVSSKNLTEINLSDTDITDLNPLSGLINLEKISLSNTQVNDLSGISNLLNLKEIYFSKTPVNNLDVFGVLPALEIIDCSNTSITQLHPLSKLGNLYNLDCSHTIISDLTPLRSILSLRRLNISNTNVFDISPVGHMWGNTLRFVEYHGCEILIPPVEFIREGDISLSSYFSELGDDFESLNEIKIIFLGEASSGKTSLVKRLMGEPFDSDENQTHGIRIRKVPFEMANGERVVSHLWDFGGQEVMHATHQFFLSQRSIYVLLLNSRNDDQAEKWLKHASSFGGNSPVFVILNKVDENPSFDVDRRMLREKYPQIRDFFKVSCKDEKNAGLLNFQEALCHEIEGSVNRKTPFPFSWLAVKEHFADMQADFIGADEFTKICITKGISQPISQHVLLQFLHDLGVVINFQNLHLFDTQILNPLWLTNGVYRIINSEHVASRGGLLSEIDFDRVINDPRYTIGNTTEKVYQYPKSKLMYIVRVMEEFELCFMLHTGTYVIPQLLPVEGPEVSIDVSALHFIIDFQDFLPDSIFPRLMVKLHTYIRGNDRWRTGMVLQNAKFFNATAEVWWDKADRKIRVMVWGDDRRDLLSFIRATIKEITDGFAQLKVSELVPVPGCNESVEYEDLTIREKCGETEIFISALKKRIPISSLLDGVEDPAQRDKNENKSVNIFVAYDQEDVACLKPLKNNLAVAVKLQNLHLWSDRDIRAGDEYLVELENQMIRADIIVCIISADFIGSDFCNSDAFNKILGMHGREEKSIIPVLYRNVHWEGHPLSKLQGIPGEWMSKYNNGDEAWADVSKAICEVADLIREKKKRKPR